MASMNSSIVLYPMVWSILEASASSGPIWRSLKLSRGSKSDAGFLILARPLAEGMNQRGRWAERRRPSLDTTPKLDIVKERKNTEGEGVEKIERLEFLKRDSTV